MKITKAILNAVLAGLLLAPFSSFAGEGTNSGGGGDPYEIYAVQFPDPVKIESAIRFISAKVNLSNLPLRLRIRVVAEMESLKAQSKYRYLNQILLAQEQTPEGYQIPSDIDRFVGLGAMTRRMPGAAIFFSSHSLTHSEAQFAHLVLHEILHHTLSLGLSEDESFIERLADAIFLKRLDPKLLRELDWGFAPRFNAISLIQLTDAFLKKKLGADISLNCGLKPATDESGLLNCEEKSRNHILFSRRKNAFGEEGRILPKNLGAVKLSEVRAQLSSALTVHRNLLQGMADRQVQNFFRELIRTHGGNINCLKESCTMNQLFSNQ